MRILESNVIFEGHENNHTNNISFCGLSCLKDKTFLATARLASNKDTADGNVGIWRSSDLGKTWIGPQVPFETSFENRRGCLRAGYITELKEDRLLLTMNWVDRSIEGRPLYNNKTGGLCDMFPVVSVSCDGGDSWKPLRKVDLSPVTLPSALTGPTLVLNDGSIACQFEVQKTWNDPNPIFNISTLKISHDVTKSWPEHVEVAGRSPEPIVFWDQRIAIMDHDKMINLFWAYNAIKQKDENIHISFGRQNARLWTHPEDTGIQGQIACPVVMNPETIIMLYIRRDNQRQIRAQKSIDGGLSWDHASEIVLYNHHDPTEETENLFDAMTQWSYGHPFGVKINDNEIGVVYYAGQGRNTSLRFYRIEV